jgi:5-methyltetrahydropteroyltriglutamate--homocysteine methyltransferase
MDLRIAYEDAVRLAAQDQELAGLDILADAQQYMPWETPAFQIEPIFHYNTEMLEGFRPWGPPNSIKKYEKFYMSECVEKIRWVRPIFEGVLVAMKEATSKPFKISCFGPGQNSVIVSDRYYNDNVALSMVQVPQEPGVGGYTDH